MMARPNGVLAESTNYIVTNNHETVYLHFKDAHRKPVIIGDFYGDPDGAIISYCEHYVAMVGCGVIVYLLKEPFDEYNYETESAQYYEFHRYPDDIWWACGVHQNSVDSEDIWFRFYIETDTQKVAVYRANVETKENELIS